MKKNILKPDYARYTSIAVQMAVVILLGVFGGVGLDRWLQIKFPIFTLILSLASVALAIYIVIREFLKPK
jgi:F0F1-type ATP synthase assembly protein I